MSDPGNQAGIFWRTLHLEPVRIRRKSESQERPRLRRAARFAWRHGSTLAAAYLLVIVMVVFFEERLIFRPARYPEGDWNPPGLQFRNVEFRADDGIRLHGWFCPVAAPRTVVLYSHGNGGNITHRADEVRLWQMQLNVSVFIYDYRGYGRSEGRPNERGVYADARAAYRYLTEELKFPAETIVLHGESLGCAVTMQLALEVPHKAMTLQSPFTSMADMGKHLYPWLPAGWLVRNRFDSLAKIGSYRKPLLILHGTEDSVVPFEMGRELFKNANPPKRFYAVSGAGHNDVSLIGGQAYFREIQNFLGSVDR